MKAKILGLIALALISLVVLPACSKSGHKSIKAADYADSAWELQVEEAELHCKEIYGTYSAVWVEHDGKQYALNGFAIRLFEDRGLEDFRRAGSDAGSDQDDRQYFYGGDLVWRAREPDKAPAEGERRSRIETAFGVPKPNINNSPLMCEGVALCGKKHWGACPD